MKERKIFNSREDWLKHRTSCIGGSECSAIVGCNPYLSNLELWQSKVNPSEYSNRDLSDNPFVRYGIAAEEHIRALFALDHPELKVEYYENNMWLNTDYPFAHASLDGELIDENGRCGVLEIKTTNILQSVQKEKWADRIPDNYYTQILWYLAVTGYDFAILVAQLKTVYENEIRKTIREYHFERSEVEEDIEYLMQKGKEFAELIRTKKSPNLVLPNI